MLLIVALVVPWVVHLGPVAMSTYRLVLLALAVPCAVFWLNRRAGSIRAPDLLVLGYCLWCGLALLAVHGSGGIEPGGILLIETFGAYLVGRCYIRSADDFRAMAKLLFLIVAAMLPFALVETVTGITLMLDVFATVLPTVPPGSAELRFGLTRVQGPFDHPILFGVFCGGLVTLTHLVLGRQAPLAKRWLMTATVAATAVLSWSSGPMVAIGVQVILLGWNVVFKNIAARWYILLVIVVCGYTFIEMASNQTVPQLLTRFAFNSWTAYYRLLIWDYGWISISLHPLFGTGFNEWVRPSWMPPSIDMFWIVPAIRHGLPALALLVLALVTVILSIIAKPLDERAAACRTAFLITLAGFFLAGWTVHFWNATYVLFMFLVGSGMWMLDASGEDEQPVHQAANPGFARRTRGRIARRSQDLRRHRSMPLRRQRG